jgi:hypothetical protein
MPDERLSAREIRYKLEKIIKAKTTSLGKSVDQVVPDIDNPGGDDARTVSKASFLKVLDSIEVVNL